MRTRPTAATVGTDNDHPPHSPGIGLLLTSLLRKRPLGSESLLAITLSLGAAGIRMSLLYLGRPR
jgi:hypothetical protein